MTERPALLALLRAERQALLDKYGQGVRPGWVSTDLALLDTRIARVEKGEDDE